MYEKKENLCSIEELISSVKSFISRAESHYVMVRLQLTLIWNWINDREETGTQYFCNGDTCLQIAIDSPKIDEEIEEFLSSLSSIDNYGYVSRSQLTSGVGVYIVSQAYTAELHGYGEKTRDLDPNGYQRKKYKPSISITDAITGGEELFPTHLNELNSWYESFCERTKESLSIKVINKFGYVLFERGDKRGLIVVYHNGHFRLQTKQWEDSFGNLKVLRKQKEVKKKCKLCKRTNAHSETGPDSCYNRAYVNTDLKNNCAKYVGIDKRLRIYADFECLIDKNSNGMHKLAAYCIVAIRDDKLSHILTNVAHNENESALLSKAFVEAIRGIAKTYVCSNSSNEITTDPSVCCICGKNIAKNEKFLRNRRNYINNKKGNHHLKCWRRRENSASVMFHNFRHYDMHFIIDSIMSTAFEMFPIVDSSGSGMKSIFFSAGLEERFIFGDTFQFLKASLGSLVKTYLRNATEDDCIATTCDEERTSKGGYDYEWFDSWDKLYENNFEQNLRDYVRLDTKQLCDVFEMFRRRIMRNFKLDACNFVGMPSLTWAMACNLENINVADLLIKDKDVYIDILCNIRGGIAQVLEKRFIDTKLTGGQILVWDVNSLYSYCMMRPLLTQYMRTVRNRSLTIEELKTYTSDSSPFTVVACVDLAFNRPLNKNDAIFALPFCPYKTEDDTLGLICDFADKHHYLTLGENLLYYITNGMHILRWHYYYVFKQDKCLANYISNNIAARKETTDKVYQDIFKDMNNHAYGKTFENAFKYKNGIFVNGNVDENREEELFQTAINIYTNKTDENSKIFYTPLPRIPLEKPIQIGFSVVEHAKLHIYQFIAALKEAFGNENVVCLYSDTDSLFAYFPNISPDTHPIDWLVERNPTDSLLELLDYDESIVGTEMPKWRTKATYKTAGKWLQEFPNKKAIAFAAVKSKVYALKFNDETSLSKCKGASAARDIHFDKFCDAIFNDTECFMNQLVFKRNSKHEVRTDHIKKKAFSGDYTKRSVSADRNHCIPFYF